MKRFASLLQPCMACVIAATFILFSSSAQAGRLLDESFENFDANDDPIGWVTAGHPGYLRVRNESEGDWTTPNGEYAMQTYSSGVGTKSLGIMPTGVGDAADGDYTVKFNISGFAAIGEYRAELWVYDGLNGWTLLDSTEGDTDGSKDFSFSDELTWRYNYDDWVNPEFEFSTIEGQELQIKLMQDPNRSNWRNTPIWDNVTVDYVPDIDTEGPTLLDIADDNEGTSMVATNSVVTYTLTFSEAMNPSTVDTADFGNAGSAPVTIQSVTPGSDVTVFLVEVLPTGGGSLRLKINDGAELEDTQGNLMDTSSQPIQDNVTFTVVAGIPTILPSDFVDNQDGGSIEEDTLVTYTLTFSTDMDASSITDVDFDNAGNAPITIGAITETSPGVFSIEVTPTGSGTLQFKIKEGVLITAANSGELNTGSAIADDTIIIVDSVSPTLTEFKDDAGGSPVAVNSLLTYEVFFSEAMDLSSMDASDFGNALTSGNAPFTIDSIEEASPGVIRIEITPTGAGSIQLQVNASAVLKDTAGNDLDTTSAIPDDIVISVEAVGVNPYETWSGATGTFEEDANADGVPNGLAWLLGASDVNENSLPLLPNVSVNASGDLVLSFRILKTANRGSVIAKVQYSTDMGATDLWSVNEAEVPDTNSTVNGIAFETTDDGDYVNVTATIPASAAAPGNMIFARIVAEML